MADVVEDNNDTETIESKINNMPGNVNESKNKNNVSDQSRNLQEKESISEKIDTNSIDNIGQNKAVEYIFI